MLSRRRFLRTAGTLTATVAVGTLLTGCLGDENEEPSDESSTGGSESDKDTDVALLNEERTDVLALLSTHKSESPQHWHFSPLRVRHGENVTVTPRIHDRVVENFTFEEYDFKARTVNESQSVIELSGDGEYVEISGENVGETEVVFEVVKENRTVYETVPFGVRVITVD